MLGPKEFIDEAIEKIKAQIGDEKAIPALEKLLDDESGFVKQGAQSAIASIKK